MPSVFGTGLLALDVVFRGREREPVRKSAGGTCGNVLAILSYLGWKAFPVARLGEDQAGARVVADLEHIGVDCTHAVLTPKVATPIIVERISRNPDGSAKHKFSLTCPCCGAWLPRYRPVPANAAIQVIDSVAAPTIFFFDRPSSAAIALATAFRQQGTLIVFEPSARSDESLFARALDSAHIVKYSDQRFAELPGHATMPFLEIQTTGASGLRFRRGRRGRAYAWKKLSAFSLDNVIDSAGSGDWCTAGLLTKLGRNGLEAIANSSESELNDAFRYAQALGAWNCGFEGARGGMYDRSRRQFGADVARILNGKATGVLQELHPAEVSIDDICPLCPKGHANSKAPKRLAAVG